MREFLHEELTGSIVNAAIRVHRSLGPGLLESVYETCLAHELVKLDLKVERQVAIPVVYDHTTFDCGFRLDLLVNSLVIIEVKAVGQLSPVHDAQLLTYLRLARIEVGLLMNFNVTRLRDGIRRRVLSQHHA